MTFVKHVRGCASKQHLCCQSGCLVFVLRILNVLNRPFIIFTFHFLYFSTNRFLLELEWHNSAFLVVNGVANDPWCDTEEQFWPLSCLGTSQFGNSNWIHIISLWSSLSCCFLPLCIGFVLSICINTSLALFLDYFFSEWQGRKFRSCVEI